MASRVEVVVSAVAALAALIALPLLGCEGPAASQEAGLGFGFSEPSGFPSRMPGSPNSGEFAEESGHTEPPRSGSEDATDGEAQLDGGEAQSVEIAESDADESTANPLPDAEDAEDVLEYWEEPSIEPCVPMQGDCDGIQYGKSYTIYPIVLAHGAAGFDQIGPLEYWWDIPDVLRSKGYEVHVAVVAPFDTALQRGVELAAYIDKVIACTCRKKVNLVGHSQGGLDARYVVSGLGYGDRVASITTIGTPHRGTAVADMVLGLLPGPTKELIDFMLWWVSGLYPNPFQQPDFLTALELFTLDGAAAFNEAFPDDPRVAYYSWAGRPGLLADGKPECEGAEVANPSSKGPVQAAFLAGWTALGGPQGVDNDGLVTVESAKWGRFRGCVSADHLREVGFWWGVTPGFDYRKFFVELGGFLKAEGH